MAVAYLEQDQEEEEEHERKQNGNGESAGKSVVLNGNSKVFSQGQKSGPGFFGRFSDNLWVLVDLVE